MEEGLYTLPVPPRLRNAVLAAALVLVAAGVAWDAGILRLPLRLEPAPEAIARGRTFVRGHCLHCHEMIELPQRVAGWSPRRAYETLGRLPEVNAAMPRFPGSEDERRAVAVYLSALGAGAAPAP
jgi:hypothetical protein